MIKAYIEEKDGKRGITTEIGGEEELGEVLQMAGILMENVNNAITVELKDKKEMLKARDVFAVMLGKLHNDIVDQLMREIREFDPDYWQRMPAAERQKWENRMDMQDNREQDLKAGAEILKDIMPEQPED